MATLSKCVMGQHIHIMINVVYIDSFYYFILYKQVLFLLLHIFIQFTQQGIPFYHLVWLSSVIRFYPWLIFYHFVVFRFGYLFTLLELTTLLNITIIKNDINSNTRLNCLYKWRLLWIFLGNCLFIFMAIIITTSTM